MRPQKLSLQIISAAIEGFEHQKLEIDKQIAELRGMLTGDVGESGLPQERRKMSAAARKRIAAAQKARWAKFRGESKSPAAEPKAKRKLSAALRAKLAANLRKARAAKAAKAKAATK